jgi:regulation of enolase protein 1 (concanavalin A-like superfamily)
MAAKRVSFPLSVVMLSLVLAGTARAELVGWWKLDGNALDSSGNGHDGVVYGGPEWVPGLIGGALKFDGVDDRVEVPGTSQNAGFAATGGEVTWAMWFKTAPSAAIQTILCQGPAGGAHVQGNRSVNVEVSGVIMVRAHSVGALTSLNSTATVNDNEWHHIAVTLAFDTSGTNDMMKVYIDGDLNKGYVVDNVNVNQYATPAADFVVTLGYRAGSPFAGTLDDVQIYNQSLSDAEVQNVVRGRAGAASPSPADGASDVLRDSTLSWSPGKYPGTHDVYLGTTFADVNTAARTDTTGPLASKGQTAPSFEPPAPLAYGQTYYWRIDEVNQSADATIYKGDVWSFTTEPYAYPVTPVAATASDSQPGLGPERTIDGSGMTGDLHGTDPTTMWASTGTQPAWIQYEFDKVYKLHQLSVWNSNQLIEAFLGFGAKTVTIETSADGTTWTPVADVPQFNRAPGAPDYAANTTVNLGGVMAKYVRLTITANWGGAAPQTGLSEVSFSYIPLQARAPEPETGATDVGLDATLNWRPGREAASHQVYLGTDPDAVAGGTAAAQTVNKHVYAPGGLNLGTTYYWRVDEVNAVTYPGEVWDFTTQEYAVVDDFESYTDKEGEEIFAAWVDGFTDGLSNSVVGYFTASGGTFGETSIIHGGRQSMPFEYNNVKTPFYSEAARTFQSPQNWMAAGADTLSLYFRGYPLAFADLGGNAYAVSGGGADIGGTADQFRFVYKQLSGDGSITARVDGQTNTNAAARAGVMVRETLDAGSRHATLAVTPASSITLISRAGTNGASTTTTVAGGLQAPYWVRVTRTGTTFRAECSPDGKAWTQAGADLTLTLGASVYVGLAVSSHDAAQISTAQFSNVATTGTVTGPWQALALGAAQQSNGPATLYLTVEDQAGKKKTVAHPDPAATTTAAWTEWRIPLSDLSAGGVNLAAVKKLTLGVGDRASPKAGSAGMLYFDDIGYGHPVP